MNYGNRASYGIHTFKFINRDNETTFVRWRFAPQDGEKPLSESQLKSMPRDFLEPALIDRTVQGPVLWYMLLTIGQPGDPHDVPSLPWPSTRK